MLPLPTSLVWKPAALISGAVSLSLLVTVGLLYWSNSSLRDDLTTANNNLALARANVATLEATLREQTASIDDLNRESNQRIAAAKSALVEAQRRNIDTQKQADRLGAFVIPQSSFEQRVRAVDAQVLESLR